MRKAWRLAAAVAGAVTWCPAEGQAVVVINEILADPPAVNGDANGDGVRDFGDDEFVELANTTGEWLGLTGWTLADGTGIRHVFGPDVALAPFGFQVVFGGGSPVAPWAGTASTGRLGLNNTGDTLVLSDAGGALIDTMTYGAEGGRDASLTRDPDVLGPFILHLDSAAGGAYSPGTTVDGRAWWYAPDPGRDAAPPVVPEPATFWLLLGGLAARRLRAVA